MRKGSSPEVANNQDWPEESPDQAIVDPPFGQYIEQPLTFDLSDAQREVLEKLGEWDMDGKTSVIGRQLGEALGVSPQKISYHTGQLEERGLIATQPDGRRKEIDLTEVMSGRRNLHVEAIGEDKQAISRIARDLSNLGLEIEDEALVQADHHHPYQPFGPESPLAPKSTNLTNLRELAGDSKVVDLTVSASGDASGKSISELSEEGLLEDDFLIVAIERGEDVLMPNGETRIQEGDHVTVLSSQGDTENLTQLFTGPEDRSVPLNQESQRHEL